MRRERSRGEEHGALSTSGDEAHCNEWLPSHEGSTRGKEASKQEGDGRRGEGGRMRRAERRVAEGKARITVRLR